MAIREILQLGNPLLRETAAPVAEPTAPDVAALVADLADTLAHARATTGYGRAIAAPQIGVLRRVVFLNIDGRSPWPLVDPEIVERSEETMVVWDACLSFLSVFMQVERHRWVRVRYRDLAGEAHEVLAAAEGDLAELLQHEIDHLDGILAVDRMRDVRSLCTREEFERRHRAGSPYADAGRGAGR
jgi:peptide deformylase